MAKDPLDPGTTDIAEILFVDCRCNGDVECSACYELRRLCEAAGATISLLGDLQLPLPFVEPPSG